MISPNPTVLASHGSLLVSRNPSPARSEAQASRSPSSRTAGRTASPHSSPRASAAPGAAATGEAEQVIQDLRAGRRPARYLAAYEAVTLDGLDDADRALVALFINGAARHSTPDERSALDRALAQRRSPAIGQPGPTSSTGQAAAGFNPVDQEMLDRAADILARLVTGTFEASNAPRARPRPLTNQHEASLRLFEAVKHAAGLGGRIVSGDLSTLTPWVAEIPALVRTIERQGRLSADQVDMLRAGAQRAQNALELVTRFRSHGLTVNCFALPLLDLPSRRNPLTAATDTCRLDAVAEGLMYPLRQLPLGQPAPQHRTLGHALIDAAHDLALVDPQERQELHRRFDAKMAFQERSRVTDFACDAGERGGPVPEWLLVGGRAAVAGGHSRPSSSEARRAAAGGSSSGQDRSLVRRLFGFIRGGSGGR